MQAIKQKIQKPIISVQVINMTCACGGGCVNEQGSYMIEHADVIVKCEECGEKYSVPAKPFTKRVN